MGEAEAAPASYETPGSQTGGQFPIWSSEKHTELDGPVPDGGWAAASNDMWDRAAAVIAVLSAKWALEVLRTLAGQRLRYNELIRAVAGIHPAVLSGTLRRMREAGLVERHVAPGPPPEVSYRLTGLARTLFPQISALARWADVHSAELGRHPAWHTIAPHQEGSLPQRHWLPPPHRWW
jgi:DNA-binding HxlR family transcriptional regulator